MEKPFDKNEFFVVQRVRIALRQSNEPAVIMDTTSRAGAPSPGGPVFDITDRATLLSYWAAMKLICAQKLASGWLTCLILLLIHIAINLICMRSQYAPDWQILVILAIWHLI